ncbi:Protein kinase domain [Macleaya cordata]|uniref:Protein kinase domain n=1 Tax=Macleaya cordata TaxID=56857 RepID=A0A200Q8Y4_MACCD|nr:Protein kinase domain [Macleaya cordata]
MAFHALLIMFHSLVSILVWLQLAAAVLVPITGTKPGCKDKCGNVNIPYPFGIGEGCFIGDWFNVTCNDTFSPHKPFYGFIEILDISVLEGEMKLNASIATSCDENDGTSWVRLAKFTFSETRNKFIAIGCNTIGYFGGTKNESYFSGCLSLCNSINDVTDGSCEGIGCCETSIEKGLMRYDVTARGFYNRSTNYSFSPCSYAFVAEENWFKFHRSDIKEFNNGKNDVPVVIEWTVGNEACDEAKKNSKSYGCGSNTNCYEPGNAPGYRCKCKDGYKGNPYLTGIGSCQDVDECKTLDPDPCRGLSAYICINTEGGYNCTCPSPYRAQTRNDGSVDCGKPDDQLNKIIIATASGFVFLLVSSSWLYWVFRNKKLIKLKEKFFLQNGGLILQQLLKREEAVDESTTAKIFTAEELNKATKHYDESRILGKGGYGTVYKGILSNKNVVAIKKSNIVDRTQIEQFINEVVVLSQINHRNVVKLLGCCLETEVPLLVYEFVTNGTLFQHLHDHENRASSLSWDSRLRIAVEVAESLSYLHSSASIPIIHRDVKSSNVLLDNNYTAKVSDFGASRLVPVDQTQLTTLVQGTVGYLDPEYFHTGQLTEKSDVYSFGVLLAELLTGKMALSLERSEDERNLAKYFLSSIKDDRLFQILDDNLVSEWSIKKQQLKEVADLTKRCLRVKGEKRPTMKEVVMVLDGLRRSSKDPWIIEVEPNNNIEEMMHLLGDTQLESNAESSTGGYVTMDSQVMPTSLLNSGR